MFSSAAVTDILSRSRQSSAKLDDSKLIIAISPHRPDTVNKFLSSNASGAYDSGIMSALVAGQAASILEIGGIHNASIRAAAAAAAASSASVASVAAVASQSAAALAAANNAAAAAASTSAKPSSASSLAVSGLLGIGAAVLGLFVVL